MTLFACGGGDGGGVADCCRNFLAGLPVLRDAREGAAPVASAGARPINGLAQACRVGFCGTRETGMYVRKYVEGFPHRHAALLGPIGRVHAFICLYISCTVLHAPWCLMLWFRGGGYCAGNRCCIPGIIGGYPRSAQVKRRRRN